MIAFSVLRYAAVSRSGNNPQQPPDYNPLARFGADYAFKVVDAAA